MKSSSPNAAQASERSQAPGRRGLHIAILSFDRPAYLKAMLASLRPQLTADDRCYLFQDGGWNPISGRRWADESAIVACVELFRQEIPSGRAFASTTNLGIAGNYRRAEEYIFSNVSADEALFLEDDLVLSPDYLDVTAALLDMARDNGDIGYVSAYGDLWASLDEQISREGELQPMHENWGSALTRTSWLHQRPVRELYWQLVSNVDYRLREGRAIVDLYLGLGLRLYFSSQDASRWAACASAGLLRLTTRTCHGRYIGERGVHQVPGRFEKYGFSRSVWFPRRPRLRPPSSLQIRQWREEQEAQFAAGYSHSYIRAERRALQGLGAREMMAEAERACAVLDFAQATAALEQGLQDRPNAVDQEGHAIFRKELLRLLSGLRAWDDIDRLMSRFDDWSAHPWHELVLARAYSGSGKAQEAKFWWMRALARDEPEARQWFESEQR